MMTFRDLLRTAPLALCVFSLAATSSKAAQHLWDISELYTNSDGTIQFVEMFTSSAGQQFLDNHTLTASSGGETNVFTFPGDSGSPTTNKRLLIATTGFASQPGAVTPDFTLPDGFLFAPSGTINFSDFDIRNYANLPTDGVMSLHYPGGTVAANSPTNFAGQVGNINPGGGGDTPTPTSTPTDTLSPTASPTPTATATMEATATATFSFTPTNTPVATDTHTPTSTSTASPTETATSTMDGATETATPTETPGEAPTLSADLDGVPGIDSRDLVLFLQKWRESRLEAR